MSLTIEGSRIPKDSYTEIFSTNERARAMNSMQVCIRADSQLNLSPWELPVELRLVELNGTLFLKMRTWRPTENQTLDTHHQE